MTFKPLSDTEYETLATFRRELRLFMRFSKDAAVNAGLTAQQYQALLAIRGVSGATMLVGELAEQLLIRPNTATELIDRLETQGFVTRHAARNDGRKVFIGLTPAATETLESLASMHRIELQRLRPLLKDMLTRL